MKTSQTITAFAPATTSNLAIGFDILGFPLTTLGDKVSITPRETPEIILESINTDAIPKDPKKNTASMVVKAMQQAYRLNHGFSISIEKGIPLGSGLGGSAASAVAACIAMTPFIDDTISKEDLANFALQAESKVSGGLHGDNVVPSLFGGFCLLQNLSPLRLIQLPLPSLTAVFIHPHMTIETKEARRVLKPEVSLKQCIQQTANLAGFMAALYTNDNELLSQCCEDNLIEPMRSQLIPGFYDVQKAALSEGALACSLSGSGPTLFAFADNEQTAQNIAYAMQKAFAAHGLNSDKWLSPISPTGARLI